MMLILCIFVYILNDKLQVFDFDKPCSMAMYDKTMILYYVCSGTRLHVYFNIKKRQVNLIYAFVVMVLCPEMHRCFTSSS